MDGAVNELSADCRSEAGGHQSEEVDCRVQIARRHVDRLHGDSARRPHVRIFRPPDECRAAACARFSRCFTEVLRWPRQLYAGLKDQLIFPEIDYNKVEKIKGMNISITTTAKTDAEGLALLRHMGMPFRQ